MKKIKIFIFKNKGLLVGCFISLAIIISYELTKNIPEWFTTADFFYNLFSQLGLAYLGSFIFYIMQVYIPRERQLTKINTSISIPISRIIDNLEDISSIDRTISLYDEASIELYDGKRSEKGTYFDLVQYSIAKVNESCEKILKNTMLLGEDLVEIISNIYNSKYIETFNLMYDHRYIFKNEKEINICLDGYDKICELGINLKKYAQENNIEKMS